MDTSKVNQSQQSFNCGLGQASVNIFNGRLLFEHRLITLGSNSFQMSTSLVYNSHYKSTDFGGRKIGFGNGWKLNIQQYLFPYLTSYNLDGFTYGDYIYIDSNWFIHRFVKYKSSSTYGDDRNAYYDASGTGLKLLIGKKVDAEIFDTNNNTYYFNASGQITGVVSGINADIMKKIEYSNGNVSCIYDSRKPSRKIQFLYNDNGTLKEVCTSINKIGFTFEYEEKKISKIFKYSSTKSKELMEFRYVNNVLEYTINSTDLTALRFVYSSFSNSTVVAEVLDVAMKHTLDSEYVDSEHYLGEENNLGEGEYLTYLEKKFKRFNTIMGPIKDSTTFIYNNSYTELTSKKGVSIRYYFNTDGTVISNLENKYGNNHYTLFRPNGWELSSDGTSNITINGQKANILNSSNSFIFNVPTDKLDEFKKIFNLDSDGDGEKDDAYSEHFKISFWTNFSNNSQSDLLATLKYRVNNNPITTSMRIENTLDGAWQYVTIPVNLGLNQLTFSDISISFCGTASNTELLLADVRIERGGTPDIMIGDYKLDMESTICWNNGSHKISPEFYMTATDIFATYKSLFYCQENEQTYFDLVYCNCTKVKSVSYVELKTSDNKIVRFSIDENNIPNYYFKLIDIVAEGYWGITETQVCFHYDTKMDKYYYETKNSVGFVSDNPQYKLKDDKSVIIYKWQNADGTFRASKNTDKVKTEYFYDNYGNIESIKTYNENYPNDECIDTIYSYDDNIDIRYRENPISCTKNGITIKLNYNNDENHLNNTIKEERKTEYNYNDYNETIKNIKFKINVNNEIVEENDISYTDNNSIKTIKNSSGTTYGFGYNIFGDQDKIYKNNTLVLEEVLVRGLKNSKKINKIYQDQYKNYTTTMLYDEYGNVISQENNGNISLFEYENNNLGKMIKRLIKVSDPYLNKNYSYLYDDKGSITNCKIILDDELEFTSYSNNSAEYCIKNDNEIIKYKDSSVNNLNQNIKESIYCTKSKNDANNKWSPYEDFSYEYEYDNLGRLWKKNGMETVYDSDGSNETHIGINKEVTYKLGTELPEKLKYTVNSNTKDQSDSTEFSFTNIYKHNNIVTENITYVKEEGNRYIENPKNDNFKNKVNLLTREYEYEYDEFNRLTKEKNSYFGTYEYIYASNGMIESVKKDGVVVTKLSYDTNHLTSFKIDDKIFNVSKDNYGNIIEIGTSSITYNSRNLMDSYENITKLNDYSQVRNKFNYYYNYQGIRHKKKLVYDQGSIGQATSYIHYFFNGDKILGENWTDANDNITKKIRYFYDAEGICGLRYDGYNFTLIRDSLGNVSKVMYKGKIIGEYVYDAWGNHDILELSVTNSRDRFVLYNNPFRYKGYYLDLETGYYYCQARYYNPKLYSWLQPDSIIYLNPKIVTGLNLYCYCMNNPIMYIDPNGHSWKSFWQKAWDYINTGLGFLNPISKITAVGAVVVAICSGRWDDIKSDYKNGCLNPFNQSEDVALKSKVLSFYKGSTIVRHDFIGTFSIFGTIWSDKADTETDIRHEYGHLIQERLMGPASYFFGVAIPSVIGYFKDDDDYYSQPWERGADWLGGADRTDTIYKKGSLGWAIADLLFGPTAVILYWIFG